MREIVPGYARGVLVPKKYGLRGISDFFVKIPTDFTRNLDLENRVLGGSYVDRKYTVLLGLLRKMSFFAG